MDLSVVDRFLDLWDKMAYCYEWNPPKTASSRRLYEKTHSSTLSTIIGGKSYVGTIETDCSAKHIYCRKKLYVNGEPERITALKKARNSIRKYAETCPEEELPLLMNSKFNEQVKERLKSAHIWTEKELLC